jgi:tetratricopeptide (TPR) repeat protein
MTAKPASTRVQKIRSVIMTRRYSTIFVLTVATVGTILSPVPCYIGTWRGRVALNVRNHDQARIWLTIAKWNDPDNAEAQFLLARLHRRVFEFDQVRPHLARAFELGWPVPELEREQWIALAQTGQFQQMEQHWATLFDTAGADGPEICEAFIKDSLAMFRLDNAIRVLDGWDADYPGDPRSHFLRGTLLEVLMNWEAAAEEFRKTVSLDPRHTQARLHLGQSLIRLKRTDEAELELRRCVEQDSADPIARVDWANCLRKLGQIDPAREILDGVLKDFPNHVRALLLRGEIALDSEKPNESVDFLRRATELKPEDRELHYALAQALQSAGLREDAAHEFRLVDEGTKPLLKLSKLTRQLVREPHNSDVRYQVASITYDFKSREEGLKWFHSLLEIDSGHAPTHQALADHYKLVGQNELSEKHQRLAGQTGPSSQ